MAPVGSRIHRHASREPITKHDHIIHQHISHHILAIPHHNMPCKNKIEVSARENYKKSSYLRKTTTVIYNLPFN